jgi:UDP-N-acetylmuramoylalanine--D-glutamate ligase
LSEKGGFVVVVGLARSGVAAAEFLARRGEAVVATDAKGVADLEEATLSLARLGVRLELGGHRRETFTSARSIVVSPGVPWELPELEAARQAGVPVIAEIELAYQHLEGRVVAVTGTKGKSTTTAALGAMLREGGIDARVGGNIGSPLVSLVEGSTAATTFVVEVSSFQLEGIDRFHPAVAVKARVFRNQGEHDWAVVDADDPVVFAAARRGRARILPVRVSGAPLAEGDGAFFAGDEARMRRGSEPEERLFARSEVVLPGPHLTGDLLFAAAAARLLGVPPGAIARAVKAFRGVEHVLELVATIDGVRYYNDSKATNVEAARRSLQSFASPIVAILGGRYKGGDFGELAATLAERGRGVVAIGEARERVAAALRGAVRVDLCGSLEEAVAMARRLAEPGDVVLLAPACSSFDMFRDYAHRGRAFKEAVWRLAPGEGPRTEEGRG